MHPNILDKISSAHTRTFNIKLSRKEVKDYLELQEKQLEKKRKQPDEEVKFERMQLRSRATQNVSEPKRKKTEENTMSRSSKPKLTVRRKMPKIPTNALLPSLHRFELVWAYLKGFPSWPGVIEEITPKGKYRIHFFGDYTRADVTRRCIINFFEGFNQFTCNFGNIKLKKAVEEATYFLLGNSHVKECFICHMMEQKRQMLLNRALN